MDRWTIRKPGTICWDVEADQRLPHHDHIEMSGQGCSQYVEYGVAEDGSLVLSQKLLFPTLRTIPNNTHATLRWNCTRERMLTITHDGAEALERVTRVTFDGILTIETRAGEIAITRALLPARHALGALVVMTLENRGGEAVQVDCQPLPPTEYGRGCYGVYALEEQVLGQPGPLGPGQKKEISLCFTGRIVSEPQVILRPEEELAMRRAFVRELGEKLVLNTPDPVLNNAFALAKLRAAESVFMTRGGLFHCPGGLSYYAAVWTNDQVEYAGPFFPYLGEKYAIEASKAAYERYIPFMGPETMSIPSSIIAEGRDIWEGAGDRGDAAMYAYGASRFALTLGDRDYARKLWPAIVWCLNDCRRKTTAEGVIASDTDELENRFPSGDANLSTACLAYGALETAARLGDILGEHAQAESYRQWRGELGDAIEGYFGANVEGFDTYRYYDGNDKLRAWICLPLVFGIPNRREQTIRALFSPNLWTPDGLATESGDKVFWDRSTLYALRGVFAAGETAQALERLSQYSRRRTLGDHVPYAVEAWPEGNQQHLSAESALYCRIFTEGILGMEPMGLGSFRVTPRLPGQWDHMELTDIHAFGKIFSLHLTRREGGCGLKVVCGDHIQEFDMPDGASITVELPA